MEEKKSPVRISAVFALVGLLAMFIPFACRVVEETPVQPPPVVTELRPIYNVEPKVRVALAVDTRDVVAGVEGGYKIFSVSDKRLLSRGERLAPMKFTAVAGGFQVGDAIFRYPAIELVPDFSGTLRVKTKGSLAAYKGNLRLAKMGAISQVFTVVNYLPVEEYLPGVLAGEIYPDWHFEAQKSMAVAARSFVLAVMAERTSWDYDVSSTTASQVYKGNSPASGPASQATQATRGKVLWFNNRILKAYYSSACGGATENMLNIGFNGEVPDVRGATCGFCDNNPNRFWTTRVPISEISAKLRKHNSKFKTLRSITIPQNGVGTSGRLIWIELSDGSTRIKMRANDFRLNIAGSLNMKSTFFRTGRGPAAAQFDFDKGSLVIAGTGFGHGAGMCQFGMQGMARENFKSNEIVTKYYPGATLQQAYR